MFPITEVTKTKPRGPPCTWLPAPHWQQHTLSIAFQHLPPNSSRNGYATERALFISAQLFTNALKDLGTNKTLKATEHPSTDVNTRHICFRVEKEFHLDSNDSGFISAGINYMGGCRRNIWNNLSWLLQMHCRLSINNNNNNVHLSCAHKCPERSHDTY